MNILFGQTIEDLNAIFNRGQMDSTLLVARNIIEHDKSNSFANLMAGRALVAKYNLIDAIDYLEKVKTFSDAPAHDRAWAMRELGLCYYSKGEYTLAKENLLSAISLNATRNVTSSANFLMSKLGFAKVFNTWSIKESTHFIFHFEDTLSFGYTSIFINRYESAFDSINSFFKAKLPKKIDFFVWRDSQMAEKIFKHPLSFSEPSLCLTHTEANHTVGHEITHSISFHAVHSLKQNRLISEGVCVYFDFSGKNNAFILKSESKIPISITHIWKNNLNLDEQTIYLLGGELVKRLIETFGRDKFIQLLSDQTYDNAKKIYGRQLDILINKLEDDIQH